MKKKLLLKSAAAVISVLTLAPYFLGVAQVEAVNNKCRNLLDPEGEQRSQYKRQRCSTEEDSTNEMQSKLPGFESVLQSLSSEEEQCIQYKRQRCSTEEDSTNETQFKLPSFESVLQSLSSEEEQCIQYKRQRCSTEEIGNAENGIAINQSNRRKEFNLKELVMFILQHTCVTHQEVADYFHVSKGKIDAYLYRIKETNESLYNRLKEKLDKPLLPKTANEVFEFIFYTNATSEKVANYYTVSPDTVNDRFRKVESDDIIRVMRQSITNFNTNRYVQNDSVTDPQLVLKYIHYIVCNIATYQQAADHFHKPFVKIFYAVEQLFDTPFYDYVKRIACGSCSSVTPEKVGNYIVANKATNKQAAENFGVAALNPKLFENIKNIYEEQLAPEKVMDYIVKNYGTCEEDGIAINQSNRGKEFNLKELVTFIAQRFISQHTCVTHQEVADYFHVSKGKIDAYLYRLKGKDELLYNTIKNKIDKPSFPETAEEVFEFIFYTNATSEKVANYYTVNPNTVSGRFRYDKVLQAKRKQISFFNRHRTCSITEKVWNVDPEVIGNYILENKATYQQAAEHFGTRFMRVFYSVEELFDTPLYDNVKNVACGFVISA